MNALVVTPVELVRNRLVVSQGAYSGPRDCVGQAWRRGGFRGLWIGLLPTLCRDGPGVGAWFLAFAAGKDGLLAWKKSAKGLRGGGRESGEEKLGVGGLLLAGSGAGVAFWTVALPFDTVKSVMQVAGVGREGRREGMGQVIERLVREGGLRRLFRGWQGAFGRAVPGSAATLATFDVVKDWL